MLSRSSFVTLGIVRVCLLDLDTLRKIHDPPGLVPLRASSLDQLGSLLLISRGVPSPRTNCRVGRGLRPASRFHADNTQIAVPRHRIQAPGAREHPVLEVQFFRGGQLVRTSENSVCKSMLHFVSAAPTSGAQYAMAHITLHVAGTDLDN